MSLASTFPYPDKRDSVDNQFEEGHVPNVPDLWKYSVNQSGTDGNMEQVESDTDKFQVLKSRNLSRRSEKRIQEWEVMSSK